jgi:hypothetical protein
MQASYVFRQVPGDCLDLHYLSFIAFSCPNLLQEVDRFDDLDVLLKNRGFRGVHKSRTGEASDGCAIFWKENL